MLIYSSTQPSTTAESIVYNGAPAATYYVKVYRYNGNTSTTAYTLRVSTQSTAWLRAAEGTSTTFASRSGKAPADELQVMITNPVEAGGTAWLTVSGYDGPAELSLRDTQGQLVGLGKHAEIATGKPLAYALPAGLRPGVYVVSVQMKSRIEYLRVLVQ